MVRRQNARLQVEMGRVKNEPLEIVRFLEGVDEGGAVTRPQRIHNEQRSFIYFSNSDFEYFSVPILVS